MTLVKSASSPARSIQSFQFVAKQRAELGEGTLAQADDRAEQGVEKGNSRTIDAKAATQSKQVAKESHFLDRIDELEKALSAKDEALKAAKTKAYEDGVAAGKEAARSSSEEALKLLQKAIEENTKSLAAKLDDQLGMSINIARAIVRRILGDQSELPAHVAQTASRWRDEVAQSSLLKVRVSAADFPDPDSLTALEQEFSGINVVAETGLERGACLLDLKLGTLDASISRQLENAEAFLDQSTGETGEN